MSHWFLLLCILMCIAGLYDSLVSVSLYIDSYCSLVLKLCTVGFLLRIGYYWSVLVVFTLGLYFSGL